MVSIQQMTGMRGLYLVAAEMTYRGIIVSPTSRSAKGADLLATAPDFSKAWSIQVKTNRKPARYWLLGKNYTTEFSDTHVYVFVNLRGADRPDFYVVPSSKVAALGETPPPRGSAGSIWHLLRVAKVNNLRDKWSVFGVPDEVTTPIG